MSLPIYQHINIRSASLDDLTNILQKQMNLKRPVAINVRNLPLDQQREIIGLIENYFVSHHLSFRFPYPIYLVTHHESTISQMPVVQNSEELPQFYNQKETKMNVRETHLINKNKLLQQEITNNDALAMQNSISQYGMNHRKIYDLEIEREFYRSLLNRLMKGSKRG